MVARLLSARFAVVILGIAAAVLVSGIYLSGTSVDFVAFYIAGKAILTGHSSHLYDLTWSATQQEPYSNHTYPFLYAPAWALLFAPLALLPFAVARIAWLLASLVGLVFAFRISRQWLGVPVAAALALSACYAPLVVSLVLGQTTCLMILVLALVASDEWRGTVTFRTGVVTTLALYKPHLLIPLVAFWLLHRRWRACLGLLSGALAVALTSLVLSPTATVAYIHQAPKNALRVGADLSHRGSTAALIPLLGPFAILLVVVVAVALLLAWKPGTTKHHRLAALFLSTVLLTPHLGVYDLALALLGLSFLAGTHAPRPALIGGLVLVWLASFLWFFGWEVAPGLAIALMLGIVAFRAASAHTPAVT